MWIRWAPAGLCVMALLSDKGGCQAATQTFARRMESWIAARGGQAICEGGLAYAAWPSLKTPRLGEPLVIVLHAFACGAADEASVEWPLEPEYGFTRITISGPKASTTYTAPVHRERRRDLVRRVSADRPATEFAHVYLSSAGPVLTAPGAYEFVINFQGTRSPLTLQATIAEPPSTTREAVDLLLQRPVLSALYGLSAGKSALLSQTASLARVLPDTRYAGYLALISGLVLARQEYDEPRNVFVKPDCETATVLLRKALDAVPDPVFAARAATALTSCDAASATRPKIDARTLLYRRFPYLAAIETDTFLTPSAPKDR